VVHESVCTCQSRKSDKEESNEPVIDRFGIMCMIFSTAFDVVVSEAEAFRVGILIDDQLRSLVDRCCLHPLHYRLCNARVLA